MQQKVKIPGLKVVALLVIMALAGSTVTLMMTHIPAPQHPIEKQLDAKAFFGQR